MCVVGKDHHIFTGVAKVAIQVRGHVLHVVDAAAKLASLVEVVDADEKSFTPAATVGVLEGVGGRGAAAEGLCR